MITLKDWGMKETSDYLGQNITCSDMPQAKLVHCFITSPMQYLPRKEIKLLNILNVAWLLK